MKKSGNRSSRKPRANKLRVKARSVPKNLSLAPSAAASRSFLAYVDGNTLTEAAAGLGDYRTFRLNSLFDPDFTGVGSSALGFANMGNIFRVFRVTRARVIARFSLVTPTGPCTVGLIAGGNSVYSASLQTWQAQPSCTSRMIQYNGAQSVAEFDVVYDFAKLMRLTPDQFKDDMDFTHTAGSNPARPLFVTLFCVGSAGVAVAVAFTYRIIFDVEMSQPSQSMF